MTDDSGNRAQTGTRVLFVHNIMAPYRLPIFRELSRAIALRMFFLRKTDVRRLWKVPTTELSFDYTVARGPGVGNCSIPFNLCWELARKRYDVFITGETFAETVPSCLILIFFKYMRGSKVILMTEYFERESWLNRDGAMKRLKRTAYRTYLKFLYSRCDAFVACSSKAAGQLKQMGVDNRKIFLSPQAVFDAQPLPGRDPEQKKGGKRPVTILTVAYLSDTKGIDLLIRAFAALNNPHSKLVIAGEGEIRPKLEALASGREDIEFAGHVEGVEKRALFEAADLFVLPSHLETWGLVVNEAMHYGLPVIITDAMGSTDLIDGNGIIIEAGDQDALIHALKELVENPHARTRMGERSREIIRLVDLHAVTEPFFAAVGHVLGQEAQR